MEIQNSKNYKQFEMVKGNRPVNRKKIKNLKDEAKNGLNLFPYCPIVVYKDQDKFKIIDGQHRFVASTEMKAPVYYVVCEQLSLVQIAKLNSNSSNWTNKNFLDCFIKTGLEDYKDVAHLIKTYKVSYSVACDLLMLGHTRSKGSTLEKFREGQFKSKHLKKACALLDEVYEVFGGYDFYNHGYLIEAYRQMLEVGKFDKEVLKEKVRKSPHLLERRLSVKEYLFAIERQYNDRNQKRVSIF